MKFAKSFQFWVCLALFLSLLLAACGDSSPTAPAATTGGSTSGATTAAAGSATTPANSAPVDLNLWLPPAVPESGSPPADWEAYKVIRDKLNINLKVNFLPVGADGETKLNAAAAANTLPDLFQATRSQIYNWANQGLIAPTSSLLPMMPERTKARYSNDTLNKLVTFNGTLYGLQEPAQLFKRQTLWVRKDWLDKLGLKAPTTLDEFYEVAKAFTEKDPDGNGKNDTYGFGAMISSYNSTDTGADLGAYFGFIYGAYGVAGTWNLSPDKFGVTMRDPRFQQATTFVNKLVQAKVIDPDWPTLKLDDLRARYKQGKYGMFWEDFCTVTCQANYKALDDNNPNAELIPLPPLKGPNGDAANGAFTSADRVYGISKKAMDAGKGPAIAKFLEWANSGDGYYLLGFGQKGVNFNLDASGNVTTEGIDPKKAFNTTEIQPITQLRNLAYVGSPGELKIRYAAFETKNKKALDPLKYYQTIHEYPAVDLNATLLIKPLANQADINRYLTENIVQFALGQKPINDSTWAEFVKGMNSVGVQDWEAQAKQALQQNGFLK